MSALFLENVLYETREAIAYVTLDQPRLMNALSLKRRDYDRWLDRGEIERLPLNLLRPFDAEAMVMYSANPGVGNVRNNGEELMRTAIAAAEDEALPL